MTGTLEMLYVARNKKEYDCNSKYIKKKILRNTGILFVDIK